MLSKKTGKATAKGIGLLVEFNKQINHSLRINTDMLLYLYRIYKPKQLT